MPWPVPVADVGINPAGAITGAYFQPIPGNPFGGNRRGFLRAKDGSFTMFDAVPSPSSPCCTWTFGIAINPAGEIAGWDNDYHSVNHAFLRAKNGTLTILDAPGAGTGRNQGTLAFSINPRGQIAGIYPDASDVYQRLLVDEALILGGTEKNCEEASKARSRTRVIYAPKQRAALGRPFSLC